MKLLKTLVGFYDILGYSEFIDGATMQDATEKIRQSLKVLEISSSADISALKLEVRILSDSILVIIDTSHNPLNKEILNSFFATCSNLMYLSIRNGLPVRGAIGGGYFYEEDNIIVSSALVDAARYEKKQEWLGAVLTPKALEVIDEAGIDISAQLSGNYLKKGRIPWKEGRCIADKKFNVRLLNEDVFYIQPLRLKNWKIYRPSWFTDDKKIENSEKLYEMT